MKRKTITIFLIIIAACTSQKNITIKAFGEQPILLRQPYLQMARSETITITWKTNAITKKCFVEFKDPNKPKKTIVKGRLINHEGNKFNEVVLKGLEPETVYNYAIYSNGHLMAGGDEYYFKTSPNNKNTAFSFYALGDIGERENISFAKEPAARIKELKTKPDFGLGLGDIVYPSGESKRYDNQLFKPFQGVFKNTPFYPVVGNHDWYSDPEKNFEMEWRLPGNEHYYSFAYSNTLFIGLDSSKGAFFNREKQVSWLKKTLSLNKDQYDWIILYLHHNGKTCTYKPEGKQVIKLYKIFSENNVDLVLNGHAHTYERLKPYDSNGNIDIMETEQTKYADLKKRFISITIGAGGKLNKNWKIDLNNPKNCKDGTIVAHAEHVPSFGLISIDGKKLNFKAINSFTGEEFDSFSITK